MKCPYCNHKETKVIDSRETDGGKTIRRRRECEKCKERFSTYEQIEILNLLVVKRDGEKEEYKKEKLEESLKRATNKRLTSDEVEQLVSDIESQINVCGKSEISTKEIGTMVLYKLKEVDEVSYLRFASVFKSFGSAKRFIKELEQL
ncbi:MAG: transcriptional regulator NrdR [Patescibacteria group bacterium]|jgi:transcriptional repressor NrdR|nr:transcriptional regulator NrdR [Patescibacteria group bacterium]